MSEVSENQIKLYAGGNYTLLEDYFNRRIVRQIPFNNTYVVSPAGADYALVPSTIVAGSIAKGTTSTTVAGGVVAAALAGAVGAGAITSIADANGSLLNLVEIRDATTNDPIIDANNRRIWGLIQCASTVTDGDPIGGVGSENVQISFVVFDSSSALVLATTTATVEFQINKLYSTRYLPTLMKEGGVVERDVIDPNQTQIAQVTRRLTVTTQFNALEVMNINTGVGSGSGAATATLDTVALPASAALFNANGKVFVMRNGVEQDKGNDVVWDSTTSLHFIKALRPAEVVRVIAPASY